MTDARVLHRPQGGETRVLATEVEFADGLFSQSRGLMFRRSVSDGYALVFRFDRQRKRGLHMLFVPFAIDAVWVADGVVQRVERLRPWLGRGHAVADVVIELRAGAAADVSAGDSIAITSADRVGD